MNKLNRLIVFGVVLFLAGCSNVTAPTATLEPGVTEALPTQITITPSKTSTFTPEPSLTSTQTITQTLEPVSSKAIGECHLPCWWGITPGVTTWEETLTIFKNMESQGVETEGHLYSTESKLPNGLGYVWVYRRDDGIVYWIDISSDPVDGIQYYDLLTDYGEPTEIYLFTYKNMQTSPPWLGLGERPAYVVFYYEGQGILAEYEFFAKLNESETFSKICPRITSQSMDLEPSGTILPFEDIKSFVMGISDFPLLRIEDATSMTKHDFYQLYKNKNQTMCFETPASLWP